MTEWTGLDWASFLVGYFGLSGIALFLLDRSHRRAFDKLSELYVKTLEHQAMLLDVIKLDTDALKTRADKP